MACLWLIGLLAPFIPDCAAQASPVSTSGGPRRILILIGYTDGHDRESLADFFRFTHSENLSLNLETLIRNGLETLGFEERRSDLFIQSQSGIEATLVNSNASCPGEKLKAEVIVYTPCPEQLQRSAEISAFLDRNLRTFDELYYIGHARRGLGLAIGPFQSDSTYRLFFHNEVERGRLGKVVMAACESNRLYRGLIGQSDKIEFHGVDQALHLQSQLTPFLLNQLAEGAMFRIRVTRRHA
jgi:hypothetical protein